MAKDAVDDRSYDHDFIIIGSGFGGSVSALRLTEKGFDVAVMGMGRRWKPEDFPTTNWNLRQWLWRPALGFRGFYNMRSFKHVVVASGNAVGGGSITYANALYVPPDSVWNEGSWAGLDDWAQVMPPYYALAERMLGVTDSRIMAEADRRMKTIADLAGVGATCRPPRVGVFFGAPGEPGGTRHPDPYFGGEGPERASCTGCGGCMMGCRHDAKNSLDRNYLYLAEKRGAQVHAETQVIDVRPIDGEADGSAGYEVVIESSTKRLARGRRTLRCRGVVFAASALGTMDLLFKLKAKGSLPRISDDLGHRVRTNAESLIGVRFPKGQPSMSEGLAGGASTELDERTHVGVVRYPEGSDAIGLMTTLLAGGRPGWRRIMTWAGTLLRRPKLAWAMHNPVGFARQTMLFLVMQRPPARSRAPCSLSSARSCSNTISMICQGATNEMISLVLRSLAP